ncbi:N-acetylgalactosamine-6-sulfatase-like [Oscarella lobularis]|uniref:N-acetylgalactosamine-6-sulfatase-like n=1 Tax=Oscarella lobularis TaxID=121494 RepID=UPI00331364FA
MFLALIILAAAKITTENEVDMPNFIFVMADDYGWGDVGYNNGTADTPSLDAMAKGDNTMLMQRYYSGGPVCSPTRGTVLTGRNHNRYCVWTANTGGNTADFVRREKMPLPLTEFTVAEAVKQKGYTTALFGKWHLGDFKKLEGGNPKWPVSNPGNNGFDTWLSTERSAPTATLNCGCFNQSMCLTGHYAGQSFACINYWGPSTHNSVGIANLTEPEKGDDSEFLVDQLEQFLRKMATAKKPFFAYVPLHTVHIRYIAVEPYASHYKKKGFSDDEVDYYGAITAMDTQIGRIRSLLSELELKNNTLLWFASDNGPAAGTPGTTNGLSGRKAHLTEGGIRVPGMIEWPAMIKKNRVVTTPVVSSDLLPTVMELLDLKMPDDRPVDGVSALSLIKGETNERSRPIGFAYNVANNFNGTYNVSWVDNRYKINSIYKKGKVAESYIYDLTVDQGEQHDLSAKIQDIKGLMLRQMEEWRQSVIQSVKKVGCQVYKNDDN